MEEAEDGPLAHRPSRQATNADDTGVWMRDADFEERLRHPGAQSTWAWAAGLLATAWGSLGVIYGDLGTSPLYTMSNMFPVEAPKERLRVLGAVSMIFWSLVVLVLIKYVVVALSMDDNGEGGAFALYSLICRVCSLDPTPGRVAHESDVGLRLYVMPRWERRLQRHISAKCREALRSSSTLQRLLLGVALVAVCLVMSDGILTPAVSVISAVEGIQHQAGISSNTVVALSSAIIVGLFSLQSFGTAAVAAFFSPIMALWFAAIGAIGVYNVARLDPSVVEALSPYYLYRYWADHPHSGWVNMGSAMLAITGAEALFADLGHFSAGSVRLGFTAYVFPCLTLSYLGQAAVLLDDPTTSPTIFWSTIPRPLYWPMVVIATLAAIIASQALITGCFSIVQQAIALNCFPRVTILHTNPNIPGQIYSPQVNYLLMSGTLLVTVGFRTGPAASAAYGLGISATFVLTTLLFSLVMLLCWELPFILVFLIWLGFTIVESAFFSSNLFKVPIGAWFILVTTLSVLSVLAVWTFGQHLKVGAIDRARAQLSDLVEHDPKVARATAARLSGLNHGTKGGETGGATRTVDTSPRASNALTDSYGGFLSPRAGAGGGGGGDDEAGPAQQLYLARTGTPLARAKGVGIYLSEILNGVPPVLCTLLSQFPALHEVVIVLTIRQVPVPTVGRDERFLIRRLDLPGFYHAVARYGYTEEVDQGQPFVKTLVGEIQEYLSPEVASETALAIATSPRTVARSDVTLGSTNDAQRRELAKAARAIARAAAADRESRMPRRRSSTLAPRIGSGGPEASGGSAGAAGLDLSGSTSGGSRGSDGAASSNNSIGKGGGGLLSWLRGERDLDRTSALRPLLEGRADEGDAERGQAAGVRSAPPPPPASSTEAAARHPDSVFLRADDGSATGAPWVQQPSKFRVSVSHRRSRGGDSRPGIPSFAHDARDEELRLLADAYRSGVSFLVGHTKLVAGVDRPWLVRYIVDVLYGTLIALAQPRVSAYKMTKENVIEIVTPFKV